MDPSTSASPPPAVGQEEIARMFQELQNLRETNAVLQREVQGLAAQVQQRPAVQAAHLRPKPSTFNGEERMLEGWLSSTRDILAECYGLSDGPEFVRAARIYLEGPARTSWDALERARGPGVT
jgi:predicted naringenin-chalcone synthase